MADLIQYRLKCLSTSKTFDLNHGLNQVGRNPTNDIRISDASVSSFHCELEVKDQDIQVRDLESTNGTFIDDQPVSEADIQAGQVLTVGAAKFQLESEVIRIAIPEPEKKAEDTPLFLPDGTPACSVMSNRSADYECQKCNKRFCYDAIRRVGVTGGKKLLFGGKCNGPCELVTLHQEVEKARKLTFFGRLTQTIRLLSK